MSKKIDVSQAQIKTANIEIKAITLNGKQMTLAVFKQLQQEQLINYETLQFNGIPWGIVNYHPDKCSDISKHIHVIWQKENELRRDTIFEDCYYVNWKYEGMYRELGKYIHELNLLINRLTQGPQKGYNAMFKLDFSGNRYLINDDTIQRLNDIGIKFCDAIIKSQKEGENDIPNLPFLTNQLNSWKGHRLKLREIWQGKYKLVSSLDQLFIAV